MKKIVYTTDYSENSIPALKYAFSLSEKLQASLFVIYVYEFVSDSFGGKTKEKHNKILTDFCKVHYGGDIEKLDVSFEAIADDSVINGILKKANSLHADLIISGTKSEMGLKELLIENKAKELISKALCPVLIVPKNANLYRMDTIVYASDFEEEDVCAIDNLVSMAKPLNAKIQIVHISALKDGTEIKKRDWFMNLLNEKVKYNNIDIEIIYGENIFESLKTYLEDKNADMVTMLERNSKGIINMLFHVDLVKKMETLGNIPLMSFNENRL
ncbi:universal stress protein [Polaribacter sp. Q13]|uniref:universal stress protein n=1 Tax=Polaribacter sp. Q13 TaxID=2806551 RepID=UPI00193AFA89|nr:universal stress protein [Polaribacter sp. Q13]QVY64740.1 universal stress protein [Polaribacter sp. Q13]